jgi:hypothetical protein
MGRQVYNCHPCDNSSLSTGYPWQVAPLQSPLPFDQPVVFLSRARSLSSFFSSGCFPFGFACFSGSGQFGFTFGQDYCSSTFEFIFRANIAYGAVQTPVIVVIHKIGDRRRSDSG